MRTSIPHFQHVVREILENPWIAEGVLSGKQKFTYSLSAADGTESITDVPTAEFESLLLRLRRVTMNDSPENIHRIRRQATSQAKHDEDRHLLELWWKYWRLSLIKEPFFLESNDGQRQIVTPFRVYNAFINGHYFHSANDDYNFTLYGGGAITSFRPHLFMLNTFHSATANIALAAIGLFRFIESGFTFHDVPMKNIATVMDFMWFRNRADDLDEQYKIFNKWIEDNGNGDNCRWK